MSIAGAGIGEQTRASQVFMSSDPLSLFLKTVESVSFPKSTSDPRWRVENRKLDISPNSENKNIGGILRKLFRWLDRIFANERAKKVLSLCFANSKNSCRVWMIQFKVNWLLGVKLTTIKIGMKIINFQSQVNGMSLCFFVVLCCHLVTVTSLN